MDDSHALHLICLTSVNGKPLPLSPQNLRGNVTGLASFSAQPGIQNVC
jgi:hypothetical protein